MMESVDSQLERQRAHKPLHKMRHADACQINRSSSKIGRQVRAKHLTAFNNNCRLVKLTPHHRLQQRELAYKVCEQNLMREGGQFQALYVMH
jgi:hypothetical protein